MSYVLVVLSISGMFYSASVCAQIFEICFLDVLMQQETYDN